MQVNAKCFPDLDAMVNWRFRHLDLLQIFFFPVRVPLWALNVGRTFAEAMSSSHIWSGQPENDNDDGDKRKKKIENNVVSTPPPPKKKEEFFFDNQDGIRNYNAGSSKLLL